MSCDCDNEQLEYQGNASCCISKPQPNPKFWLPTGLPYLLTEENPPRPVLTENDEFIFTE